jgi:hypothetical protein
MALPGEGDEDSGEAGGGLLIDDAPVESQPVTS